MGGRSIAQRKIVMQGAYVNSEDTRVAATGAIVAAGVRSFAVVKPRKWFAIHTRSRHEKRVSQHLAERGIESFLPLYKSERHWTHYRNVVLDLPLFPSYLFVHISPQERIRTLNVSGVLSLISQGSIPIPLPDDEIACLRSGLQLRKFEPHPYLAAGTKARIKAGPFAGMQGVVLHNKSGLRVVLTVELVMQSVAVEVNADEIEADSSCTCS